MSIKYMFVCLACKCYAYFLNFNMFCCAKPKVSVLINDNYRDLHIMFYFGGIFCKDNLFLSQMTFINIINAKF